MAIKNWPQLTPAVVLQKICCSTGRTLQFSDSKGYFVSNHYTVFGLLCGCWDGKKSPLHSAFSSCNVFFHPFKVQGPEPAFRNFPEITNRSHWAVLCIYFVFLYRERQQAREFKWSSEKPKRKPQVLFFSSELMFTEASSLSTRDIVLCLSTVLKYLGSPREILWTQITLMLTERCR